MVGGSPVGGAAVGVLAGALAGSSSNGLLTIMHPAARPRAKAKASRHLAKVKAKANRHLEKAKANRHLAKVQAKANRHLAKVLPVQVVLHLVRKQQHSTAERSAASIIMLKAIFERGLVTLLIVRMC